MTKEGNNINILWNTFKMKLLESLEKNIPSKVIKGNKNISWIRRKEKKMIKKKTGSISKQRNTINGQTIEHTKKNANTI